MTSTHSKFRSVKVLSLLLLSILVTITTGCSDNGLPPDTDRVKYLNRESPGAKLKFDGSMFVPKKINVLYFYADW